MNEGSVIGQRRFCEKCRTMRVVEDQFVEADHGLADAQEWGVIVLSCDHYITGPAHSVWDCIP